jgi:hypothetical protein
MKKLFYFLLMPAVLFSCGNEETSSNSGQNEPEKEKVRRDDITISVSTEDIAETGEVFQISYEVNDRVESFNPPSFEGFDVLSGPAASSFSSTSIINGKRKDEIKTSYAYTISAQNPGDFTIAPASVSIDGFDYFSDSVKLKIIGEAQGNNQNPVAHNSSIDDYFMTAEFSNDEIYNGGHILISYKLWFKSDFHNIVETSFPEFTGFKTEIVEAPRQLNSKNELYQGQKYKVALLKKVLLIAQKTGTYSVSPYSIELKVRKPDGKTRDFFGNIVDTYKIINKKVQSKRKKIVVKQLPKPAPANFSGITGHDFRISSSIDKTNLNSEDGANLKVTISGYGNIYLLNEFSIELPEGLKSFKPEIEKTDKYTDSGQYGERSFTFVIVGNQEGKYTIPAPEFVYFDTKSNSYKQIRSDSIRLNVGEGFMLDDFVESEGSNNLKDIRFIKTDDLKLKKIRNELSGSIWFYAVYFIFTLVFVVFLLVKRKNEKERSDMQSFRRKRAGTVSAKRLKKANEIMQQDESDAFFEEILNALWGYLSDKLSVPAAGLTTESVSEQLAERNIDSELIQKMKSLIETCGYAKYGNTSDDADMITVYENASDIINSLENTL